MAFQNQPRDKYAFYGNSSVGAALASSTGVEDAMGSVDWFVEPSGTFYNGRTYEVKLRCPVYGSAPGVANNLATLRVRKGSGTITGQQLAFFRASIGPFSANVEESDFHATYIKNVSGQDITTALSLTIQRAAGTDTVNIYGDSNLVLALVIEDVGDSSITVAQLATSITP